MVEVKRSPKSGDAVRVPWGLGAVVGEVLDVHGGGEARHAVVAVPVLGSSGELLETETVNFRLDALEIIEAEIVDQRDVTPPGMDGWVHSYVVRTDVNDEVQVTVWCSGTAEAMARHHDEIASVVRDRGRSWALRAAKLAQRGSGAAATVHCDSRGVSVSYGTRTVASATGSPE